MNACWPEAGDGLDHVCRRGVEQAAFGCRHRVKAFDQGHQVQVNQRFAHEQGFCGQFEPVDGEEDRFGKHIAERSFVVANACQYCFDRMRDGNGQINLAEGCVTLDVVNGAEQAGDDLMIPRFLA